MPRSIPKTGEVLGKTAERHTSAEFVAFLNDIVVNQPKGKEIHVIADNLSAHKTKRVAEFLAEHRNVHMHFTPTYSSWLNQVELWFAKIERDVIARGVFTSVPDLKRKLMRYIRHYNKAPKTVKWKYFDPIASNQSGISCYSPLERLFGIALGQGSLGFAGFAGRPASGCSSFGIDRESGPATRRQITAASHNMKKSCNIGFLLTPEHSCFNAAFGLAYALQERGHDTVFFVGYKSIFWHYVESHGFKAAKIASLVEGRTTKANRPSRISAVETADAACTRRYTKAQWFVDSIKLDLCFLDSIRDDLYATSTVLAETGLPTILLSYTFASRFQTGCPRSSLRCFLPIRGSRQLGSESFMHCSGYGP